ncbi:hypothetical protein ZIOFF_023173 [Zingiber officinale]|uniref:Sugar phosphate transporter domain-containing protein n=1 Tax=Zingiber officinale TaxID=94328 RepID=A0A8J5HAS9_ZINOF|nr:hypothetical protein ZIOFF_023173 [Zingiber officinale]
MTACSLFSYVAITWVRAVPLQTVRSRLQFLKIAVLSLVFCSSVVSGNVSLKYLPVSFNQAVGATTPFFTAVFAYVMTVKREAWITYVTLIPVVAGVVIASGKNEEKIELARNLCTYPLQIMGATAARALKTVLQGILLSSEGHSTIPEPSDGGDSEGDDAGRRRCWLPEAAPAGCQRRRPLQGDVSGCWTWLASAAVNIPSVYTSIVMVGHEEAHARGDFRQEEKQCLCSGR